MEKKDDFQTRICDKHFVYHDSTKKLVTSSSALFVEEPALAEDLVFNAIAVPTVPVSCVSKVLPEGAISVGYYNFAFVVMAPRDYDKDFGKLHVSEISSAPFEVKRSILEDTKLIEYMKSLDYDIIDNYDDAILLGSTIYSWLALEECGDYGSCFDPEPGKFYHITRETRSQLPKGDYLILLFSINAVLTGSGVKCCGDSYNAVSVTIEAAKECDSKKKSSRSKKTDDVVEQMER